MLYATTIIAVQNIVPSFDGVTITFNLLLVPLLLYRYLFYRCCGCCEKSSTSSDAAAQTSSGGGGGTTTLTQPLIQEQGHGGTDTFTPHPAAPRPRIRYAFLDNVKVFLTAVVVSHHIACVFGPGVTMIKVKNSLGGFSDFLTVILRLNQAYFMVVFFFISAFFVPSSYAKGREKFLRGKWKRILLPALVVTYLIYPIGDMLSNLYTTGELTYNPIDPAQTWFLYWLLLLYCVYMSIVESKDTTTVADDDVTEVERTPRQELQMPFPSTWKRLFFGVALCGLVLYKLKEIIPQGNLAGMPADPGSLTAYFLMFYAGILAKKHGWLEKDLAEQLDMPLWAFFSLVFVELAVIVALQIIMFDVAFTALLWFVWWVVFGAFCVDMSLAVLIIFQRWFNYETKLSKVLARSAYCVYLIHTLVLTVATITYLEIYSRVFGSGEGTEVGRVVGGWIFVNVVTQAVVWPLSYGLTRLPILRDII